MKRDFLHITDFTTDEIWGTLDLAKEIKEKLKNRENYKPFKGHSLAMIFARVVFPKPGGPCNKT